MCYVFLMVIPFPVAYTSCFFRSTVQVLCFVALCPTLVTLHSFLDLLCSALFVLYFLGGCSLLVVVCPVFCWLYFVPRYFVPCCGLFCVVCALIFVGKVSFLLLIRLSSLLSKIFPLFFFILCWLCFLFVVVCSIYFIVCLLIVCLQLVLYCTQGDLW